MKHDPKLLDAQVDDIRKLVGQIHDEQYWADLTDFWRRPGWTTPAEWVLVSGHLESVRMMLEQVRRTQETLHEGVSAVGG
ncbi:hypothetical protein HUT18_09120 [Streptomyces sp. NA04227]|uniref:hypothetical protein n=1 Tax=Streptomyces sp. NA04227 TaxID=2742136 RepID=UPI0015923A59|nr:hypothetical protein [Streptomyces sp. NA04227]QKW06540.1 hypothetical protein HUT18_09120 [Streptomyces sp. NA04227]